MLTWTPVPDAYYLVRFFPASFAPGMPTISVFTTDTSATLPDVSPYGLVLPPTTEYGWSVTAVPGVSSIDDVVAEGYLRAVNQYTVDATVLVGATGDVITR